MTSDWEKTVSPRWEGLKQRTKKLLGLFVFWSAALSMLFFIGKGFIIDVLSWPWPMHLATGIFALTLVWKYHRGLFNFRQIAFYPPTSLVFVPIISLLTIVGCNLSALPHDWLGWGFIGIGLSIALFGLPFGLFLTHKAKALGNIVQTPNTTPDPGFPFENMTFAQLTEWVADDKPATHDFFDRRKIAKRIVQRLCGEQKYSQAVVGRLGAGKTTLRKLVTEELLKNNHPTKPWVLVPIELWAYETPKAAVEGVIRGLIDALEIEVDVSEMQGVPSAYSSAMSSAGGFLAFLSDLISDTPTQPIDVLRIIDKVATTIGRRYLVWIEDLERFGGKDHRDERLNPIRAVLFGLDTFESVSVITATTELDARFDIEKIARFIEKLPDVPEGELRQLLETFRRGMREGTWLEPATADARKKLDSFNSRTASLFKEMRGLGIYDIQEAIVVICGTPRTLKQGLRHCLDVWDKLAGEIDSDDLLAMSILRCAQPDVFALIEKHVETLRYKSRSSVSGANNKDKRDAAWRKDLESLHLDETTVLAVGAIVKFVFQDQTRDKPQGFAQKQHTDYWERFLSNRTLDEHEKDQPVLKAIEAKKNETIVSLLEDPLRHQIVEDFATNISSEDLISLFSLIVKRQIKHNHSSGESREDPPGLIPIWRILLRRSEAGALDKTTLGNAIKDAYGIVIGENLNLVTDIEHYFVSTDPQVHNLFEAHEREELKSFLRNLLADTFKTKPGMLIHALETAAAPVLLWLAWDLERVRAKKFDLPPFPRWSEIAPVVLDATKQNPGIMLPQLAQMVAKQDTVMGSRYLESRHKFDPDIAVGLFGDADVVLNLFRNNVIDDDKKTEAYKSVMEYLQNLPGDPVAHGLPRN